MTNDAPTPAADQTTTAAPRAKTAVDAIADDYFARLIDASPMTATYLGFPGREDELDDFSPAGLRRLSELRRDTLARLDEVAATDEIDRVTLAAMRERLGLAEETYAAGLDEASLNVIASPLQGIREVFDLMPTATAENWRTIATRMGRIPTALDQYRCSLLAARDRGQVSAQRQVAACIAQCADLVADDGYFATIGGEVHIDGAPLPETIAADLAASARVAAAAYREIGEFLATELEPHAPAADAVGAEVYQLCSRYFTGTTLDLEETYRWGIEECARLDEQMRAVAEQVEPGATIKQAIELLDADPGYKLEGTDALREWMQGKADQVIADLTDVHFDIPQQVRTIECCIAPTQTGGIYYTGPSDDFSRPGRMWWSVPKGVTEFGTWKELTTVYHEGVPGHHLQVGQTVVRSELLNNWRRLDCWVSGSGEGWALYAERLMAELGYMEDPGNRMGWLDGQSLRAARVVIDIGVHCGFEAPAEVGGGEWTYDKAWQFLQAHANQGEQWLRFELDRYLGWPGQAPSYKIGERQWLAMRDEARSRAEAAGEKFDPKDFHRRALDVGCVGLDTLREAVLR